MDEQKIDSGFDDSPPIREMREYFRRQRDLFHIEPELMHQCICKVYGWEKWVDDPWGNSAKFNEWLNTTEDNALAVWAVNDTPGGRFYLAYSFLYGLAQFDYSTYSPKELLFAMSNGAIAYLGLKWEEWNYPEEPLPTGFVNAIIKASPERPFSAYRWTTSSIYLLCFVLNEFDKRVVEHPEVLRLLDYEVATTLDRGWLISAFAPKDYQSPNKNESWIKFEESLGDRIKALGWKYKDIFPLQSKTEGSILDETYVSAQQALLTAVNYWKEKDFIKAGLEGKLLPSLLRIVNNKLIEFARKQRGYEKHEVTESQMGATRVTDKGDATPFLDTIPSPEPMPEEPMDLKRLGFNKDKLTPGELLLLDEMSDATRKGYTKDSKEGLSLRQYWGEDYGRKIKRLKRLEAKRKKT